jgi:ribosomal protein L44E
MSSEKRGLDEENFVDTSILLDAVTSLISTFKQAGYTPPTSIQVDKLAFDELLEEASKLYSSINVKDSIVNQEFSIAGIINIVIAGGKEKGDNRDNYHFQKQKDHQQSTKVTRGYHKVPSFNPNQKQIVSNTAIKYECVECSVKFDTPAGHRKHYQAFHGRIEEPKVLEQAEI